VFPNKFDTTSMISKLTRMNMSTFYRRSNLLLFVVSSELEDWTSANPTTTSLKMECRPRSLSKINNRWIWTCRTLKMCLVTSNLLTRTVSARVWTLRLSPTLMLPLFSVRVQPTFNLLPLQPPPSSILPISSLLSHLH